MRLPIAARWLGPIHLDLRDPGVHAIAVRDDAAYDALVARLPALRIQQKQPAPPSVDPLRARPAIDFARDMLVVVTRSDAMDPPTLAAVEHTAAGLVVRYAAPRPPPAARRLDIGGYAAALVPRIDAPLVARGPVVLDDPAAVAAAVGELVTLRGALRRTRVPTLLGVDVDLGHAIDEQPAEATGWLEAEDVDPAELDAQVAASGQFAHRGAGRFYRLVASDGGGLAAAVPRR